MVDDGAQNGTNIHNVGALCQAQGKQFIPAGFHQVYVIVLTAAKQEVTKVLLSCRIKLLPPIEPISHNTTTDFGVFY